MPDLPPLEQVAPESEHEARYMGRGPTTAQPAAAHAYAQSLGLTSVKRAAAPAPGTASPNVAGANVAEEEATPERVIVAADAALAEDLAADQAVDKSADSTGELAGGEQAGDSSAGAKCGDKKANQALPLGAGASSALYHYRDSAGQEVDAAALAAPEAEQSFDVYEVRRNTLAKWAHKIEHGTNVPQHSGEITPELQAEIKAQHEAGRPVQFMERIPDFKLDILHTDPELALVGLSYEEVKERARHGHPFVSSEVRATEGRYRITHQEGGILRLYCDEATHVVLGAEMCLHDAGHLAHFLAQAIASQRTVEQLYALPYFSSSYEEIIKSAAEQALKNIARKGLGL